MRVSPWPCALSIKWGDMTTLSVIALRFAILAVFGRRNRRRISRDRHDCQHSRNSDQGQRRQAVGRIQSRERYSRSRTSCHSPCRRRYGGAVDQYVLKVDSGCQLLEDFLKGAFERPSSEAPSAHWGAQNTPDRTRVSPSLSGPAASSYLRLALFAVLMTRVR